MNHKGESVGGYLSGLSYPAFTEKHKYLTVLEASNKSTHVVY